MTKTNENAKTTATTARSNSATKTVAEEKKAHFNADNNTIVVYLPTVKKEKDTVKYCLNEGTMLKISKKATNKESFAYDVQAYCLKMMADKTKSDINKLTLKKKDAAGADSKKTWTEDDAEKLEGLKKMKKLIDTQIKLYPNASAYNGQAKLAAHVITGTSASVEFASIAVKVKVCYNAIMDVYDELANGKSVSFTKDQQQAITDVKNGVISTMAAFVSACDGKTEAFTLSMNNKEVFKLIMAMYDRYRIRKDGKVEDGVKLDGTTEKALNKAVVNMVYAKMQEK